MATPISKVLQQQDVGLEANKTSLGPHWLKINAGNMRLEWRRSQAAGRISWTPLRFKIKSSHLKNEWPSKQRLVSSLWPRQLTSKRSTYGAWQQHNMVVSTILKNTKVNGKDYPIYEMENKFLFQNTNQSLISIKPPLNHHKYQHKYHH